MAALLAACGGGSSSDVAEHKAAPAAQTGAAESATHHRPRRVRAKHRPQHRRSDTASTYKHEQGLGHARAQSGWRLPNIKEINSLADLSLSSGARIDPAAFPGAGNVRFWASSPYVPGPQFAMNVDFGADEVNGSIRDSSYAVRLVRANQ